MTQMQRQLAAVPIARRRRAATVLTLIAVLLVAIGILPWTSPAPTGVRVSAIAALIAGVLALMIAWGLARSVTLDTRRAAEAELDAVLHAAGGGCDCGHDHGTGAADEPKASAPCGSSDQADCPHTCATCVLAQQRG